MFRNIHVVLSASGGNLRSVLSAAGRDVARFEKNIQGTSGVLNTFAKAAAAAAKAGVLVFAVALAYGTTQAIAYERAMRNVMSITADVNKSSAENERTFQRLHKATLGLSRDPFINQGPVTLAKGLYDIASSGFHGAQGLIVLRSAAEAASAGMSTTAVAARAITAVLNAYGRSAADSNDVSDALFQTVNLGVVTFEELASQIGDVIGTAAAGKVPFEDVGAAIAAMTLSGISAAESATSLNRVIQALIDPSDAMASTLKGLGYESGAMALETDGLYGVMEKLRGATGGQLTALQMIFPEIRGLRGALALTGAEGENYRRTTEGISNAENRAGATRRALAEQLKAVGTQIDQFRNRLTAAGIEAGTRVLPAILFLMKAVEKFGRDAWPHVQRGVAAAMPLFRNLAQLGQNLARVVAEVAAGLSPLAKTLATLAGGAVLLTLNGIISALASLTGFLAEHSEVLQAVAILYGVTLVASIGRAALHMAQMAMLAVRTNLALIASAGGVRSLSVAMTGAQGAAVGLAIGITAALQVMQRTQQQADKLAASIAKDQDLSSFTSIQQALKDNAAAYMELERVQARYDEAAGRGNPDSFLSKLDRRAQSVFQQINPWMDNTIDNAERAQRAVEEQNKEWQKLADNALANEKEVASVVGISVSQVEEYAKVLGVDLTKGFDDSSEARERIILHVRKLGEETGVGHKALTELTGGGVEKMAELGAAAEEAAKSVGKAFADATDIFANFKLTPEDELVKNLDKANDAVQDAKDRVEDAEDRVAKARKKTSGASEAALEKVRDATDKLKNAQDAARKGGATPAEIRAVANAERDLARARAEAAGADPEDVRELSRAERDLAQAKEDVVDAEKGAVTAQGERISAADQLKNYMTTQLQEAQTFANGIAELTRRNLDPQLIARLLAQGPEEAAPVVQALLSGNGDALIRIANETEAALRQVNTNAVAFARITQTAINSNNDALIADLDLAMNIAAQKMAQGTRVTSAQIASALQVGQAEVERVALAYGIGIGRNIVDGAHGQTQTVDDIIKTDITNINTVIGRTKGNEIGIAVTQGAKETLALADLVNNGLGDLNARVAEGLRNGSGGHYRTPVAGGTIAGSVPVTKRAEGGITRMAAGGLLGHITMVPRVLYGEPETGGEAYIPLGQSKRRQAFRTWVETGRILGVQAHSGGGAFPTGSTTNTAPTTGSLQVVVPQSKITHVEIKEMRPIDFDAAVVQAERRARLSSLTGGTL